MPKLPDASLGPAPAQGPGGHLAPKLMGVPALQAYPPVASAAAAEAGGLGTVAWRMQMMQNKQQGTKRPAEEALEDPGKRPKYFR